MTTNKLQITLFKGKPEEVKQIEQLTSLLRSEGSQAKLVISGGEESIIPEEVKQIWLTCLRSMLEGKAIEIVEFNQYMTTQQAANILGVSRPFLIKLLEQGEIPYTKVGVPDCNYPRVGLQSSALSDRIICNYNFPLGQN